MNYTNTNYFYLLLYHTTITNKMAAGVRVVSSDNLSVENVTNDHIY